MPQNRPAPELQGCTSSFDLSPCCYSRPCLMVTRGRGSFQFTSLLGIPTTANGRQLLRRRNCAFSNAVNGAKASASLRSRVLAVAGKKIDPKREARMVDEIIVDTYTEDERSMSSYYHLEGALRFPFEAECVKPRTISRL